MSSLSKIVRKDKFEQTVTKAYLKSPKFKKCIQARQDLQDLYFQVGAEDRTYIQNLGADLLNLTNQWNEEIEQGTKQENISSKVSLDDLFNQATTYVIFYENLLQTREYQFFNQANIKKIQAILELSSNSSKLLRKTNNLSKTIFQNS